jgi:hypothetical protein
VAPSGGATERPGGGFGGGLFNRSEASLSTLLIPPQGLGGNQQGRTKVGVGALGALGASGAGGTKGEGDGKFYCL